jgi:hypothetical protein
MEKRYKPRPKPKSKQRRSGKRSTRGGITYSGQESTHDTDGLPGYPAVDLFASPGTPFLAPESGRIVRLSGHPGTTSGSIYGQSVYFKGRSGTMYFITHLGSVSPLGAYKKGAQLGTVSAWDSGSPHAHVGVNTSGGTATYGDTRSGAVSGTSGTSATGTPNQAQIPQYDSPSLAQGYAPPNDPGIPQPPMPSLPGSVEVMPSDPSAAWRMIAAQPLSSPEAQRWALLMGGNDAA